MTQEQPMDQPARSDVDARVSAELGERMTAKGKRDWMRSRSAYLDRKRPAELIEQGTADDLERVVDAARAYAQGDPG